MANHLAGPLSNTTLGPGISA